MRGIMESRREMAASAPPPSGRVLKHRTTIRHFLRVTRTFLAHPGIARFSAFHSRISVQSTPQTHPLAQKFRRASSEAKSVRAFALTCCEFDVSEAPRFLCKDLQGLLTTLVGSRWFLERRTRRISRMSHILVLPLQGHRDICRLARRSWLGNRNGFQRPSL